MNLNQSVKTAVENDTQINLKCGNLRLGFFVFIVIFWYFNIMFILQMWKHYADLDVKLKISAINDFFGDNPILTILPIMASLAYFIFSRKKLKWSNGLLINEKPVNVIHYQFKPLFANAIMVCIQTDERLYLLYTVTSQDNVKFPDAKRFIKEAVSNAVQAEKLKNKLISIGATERKFHFFTKGFLVALIVFVLITIYIMTIY